MLWCRYSSVSFGDRTRPQNLNWTTFYATSAEFGHFTSPSQSRARHEPSSSQAQMLLFFCFLFWVSWPRKSNKHFYINCRMIWQKTWNMWYVITRFDRDVEKRYLTSSWSFASQAIVTKLLKQRSDRNNNCRRLGRNQVFLRGSAIRGGGWPNETGEARL